MLRTIGRTTGRPTRRERLEPEEGGPVDPPGDGIEGHDDGDDRHPHQFKITNIASAHGWIARFKGMVPAGSDTDGVDLPVVAWAVVVETCLINHRQVGEFIEGFCLKPSSTTGPMPVGQLTGFDDDEYGSFEGYFPAP